MSYNLKFNQVCYTYELYNQKLSYQKFNEEEIKSNKGRQQNCKKEYGVRGTKASMHLGG